MTFTLWLLTFMLFYQTFPHWVNRPTDRPSIQIAHDTVGPMATTVSGVASLDAAITGDDPASYAAPESLGSLTVAVAADWDDKLHPQQKAALEAAVAALEAAGATVKRGAAFKTVQGGVEGFEEPSFRLEGFKAYCAVRGVVS